MARRYSDQVTRLSHRARRDRGGTPEPRQPPGVRCSGGTQQWVRGDGGALRLRTRAGGYCDPGRCARGTNKARAALHAAVALVGLRCAPQKFERQDRPTAAPRRLSGVRGARWMIDSTTGPRPESRARLRILLLAEEAAGAQVLRMIAGRGHVVVAVMTSGAARPDSPSPVRDLAERLGCPCWPVEGVRERGFSEGVRAADGELLLHAHSLSRV